MKSNRTLIIVACIVGVVLLIVVPTCSSYNSMVDLDQKVEQTWAEVQNQYQRRYDLIPNLVETVKGYANHEQATLQGVTNARAGIDPLADTTAVMSAANAALNANDPNQYASAMKELKSQFSVYVNAVQEAYPDLKANENFADLQVDLSGTENRVEKSRHDYTEAVKEYNSKIKHFPANIVAGLFGFQPREQFQAEEAAQTAPKVKF